MTDSYAMNNAPPRKPSIHAVVSQHQQTAHLGTVLAPTIFVTPRKWSPALTGGKRQAQKSPPKRAMLLILLAVWRPCILGLKITEQSDDEKNP